ncbi:MAG: PIN domain-containing protein [Planctomycetales bacterium]|nr:PIN domain-containing protein [Planctomycetales bacterium]
MTLWDSSALVMCYLPAERDHTKAKNLLASGPRHGGTALIRPEATSALVRRRGRDRAGCDAVLALLESHLKAFDLVPVDDSLLDRSVALIRAHALRSAGAIHLAGAVQAWRDVPKAPIRFVTADADQARAARTEGLRVVELRP